MEKAYQRQYFENDKEPELNEDNLNEIDVALDEIDNRVLEMHTKVFSAMKAEEERVNAENARTTAETSRVNAENARTTAEASRVNAENARNNAEENRQKKESVRIQQESERQKNTSQAVKNAEDATKAAITATNDCINITKQAEDALQNQEELEATLNTAVQLRQEVSQMSAAVKATQEQVEQDKREIDDTIQNSLLASANEILESVKSYFERAEALYSSMYLDCDGETPYLRMVTPIFIDGATPQIRNVNEGVDFDGGTPTSRLLAV